MDCQYSFTGKSIQAQVLAGFQGYDVTYQDNEAIAGCDFRWEIPHFSNRYIVAYYKYFGYGHQLNLSMVPGYSYTGRTEACLDFKFIRVCADAEFDQFEKSFTHSTCKAEVFPSVNVLQWIGIGPGYFYQQDDKVQTQIPFIALCIRPTRSSSRVVLRGDYRITDNSSPVLAVEGSVWFAF